MPERSWIGFLRRYIWRSIGIDTQQFSLLLSLRCFLLFVRASGIFSFFFLRIDVTLLKTIFFFVPCSLNALREIFAAYLFLFSFSTGEKIQFR